MTLDRRTLLTDASTILFAGTASSAAHAAVAAPRAGITRVSAIAELATVDPDVQCVDVLGYAGANDAGGGLFVWRSSQMPASDHGPRIASKHSGKGHWLRLAYEGGCVRPEWFGSLQATTDHSTLVQAAIDFIAAEGSGRVDLGNGTYRCQSRIVLDPTKCVLAGSGAVLDFSGRAELSADRPVVDLGRLSTAASGSWSAVSGGLAHAPTDFTELAVPLTLAPGQRYRITCKIDRLAGDPNIPFVRLQVFGNGLESPVASYAASSADRIAIDFEWPSAASAGRLVLSSNSEALITDFALCALGFPECLLVRSDEKSSQYGHLWIEGIRIRGRGAGSQTRLHGIRFETKRMAKSSRFAVRDLNVEGFETAVVLADRAYLVHFFNSRLIGDVGVHFLNASNDAGENISFHGCTIGGGRIGIWNGGAEINMFATSVNFAEQFYVGTGQLNAQSCHFETHRTTRPDQYLFDIAEGGVNIDASYLMIGGGEFAAGNQADYIVYTHSPYAGFSISNTYCYNLRTRTGVFAGGDGHFESRNLSGIAMNPIAPLPKQDARSNLFGPAGQLSDTAIAIDFRLSGGETIDRTHVANGRLTLLPARDGEPGMLSLEKTGETNTPLELWLIAPCSPGAKVGWSLDAAVGQQGGRQELAMGIRFIQIIGRDARAGPLVGSVVGVTQSDTALTITEADGWRSVRGSTFECRYGDRNDGSAPGFATHVALHLDAKSLKQGDQLLLRLPYAGAY